MPAKHALLSASSAERWMNCPGSVRLTEHMPETTSVYAEEGTTAHEVAAMAVNAMLAGTEIPWSQWADLALDNELYQPEMMEYAQQYAALVGAAVDESDSIKTLVEQRVSFEPYAPDGFGTVDCCVITDDAVSVYDYKYGKGVEVNAEWNPQLMLYALGAYQKVRPRKPDRVYWLTVFQPRLNHTSAWSLTEAELMRWATERVLPAALLALKPDAPLAAGEWCRWCKAKATCKVRAETIIDQAFPVEKDATLLTPAEAAEYLKKGKLVAGWLKNLQDHVLRESLKGIEYPGYKAVAGKNSRVWTDQAAAFKAIMATDVKEAMLFKREPLSLAAVEKLLTKKVFTETVGQFVKTVPGKPTLVSASDKRQAISSAEYDITKAFDEEETEE